MNCQDFVNFMDSYNVALGLAEKEDLILTLANEGSKQPIYVQMDKEIGEWLSVRLSGSKAIVYFHELSEESFKNFVNNYANDDNFYDFPQYKVGFIAHNLEELKEILDKEYEKEI